jgi:hypothetical protein
MGKRVAKWRMNKAKHKAFMHPNIATGNLFKWRRSPFHGDYVLFDQSDHLKGEHYAYLGEDTLGHRRQPRPR